MSLRDHGGIATPIGCVAITLAGEEVTTLHIGSVAVPRGTSAAWRNAADQIEQWLAGERRTFELLLKTAPTIRGNELRQAMIDIGYAQTISYGALAKRIASSPRAIGQACARNPLPIIVPCHRVLSSGDRLGFYSAGDGPDTKAWLLTHEQKFASDAL